MAKQKDIKFPLGKYNDILIADIPNHYLNWILEQSWFVEKYIEINEQIDIEMTYRRKFNIIIE